MKKSVYILITFHISHFTFDAPAQVSQQWVARYHYISEDEATDIAIDNAGNVYVTGSSEAITPNGAKPDYATIKYNSTGVQQWIQRYNGPGNGFDAANFIAVDDSGNVYVTGTSNRLKYPGENFDFTTIKYNTSGVQQWVRRYDRSGGDAATSGIVIDAQGYIYVAGRSGGSGTGSDYTIIKYNSKGDSIWVRMYDSGGNDNAYDYPSAMSVDLFGNVYLTGSVGLNNFPAPDWATVKWNSQGVFQWVQRYNGPGNGSDYPKSIAVNDSGNVYVTGYVWGNNNTDYATIKYNSSGVQQWVRFYNGGSIFTAGDVAFSVAVDDTGNVYVTGGSTNPIFDNNDIATIKYSSAGVQQWVARFNGPANSNDIAYSIKLDNKGNVYVTGYSTLSLSPNNTDFCTIKYSGSGIQQWVILYNGTGNSYDMATSLAIGSSGNLYVTGPSRGLGNNDYATVKYSQATGITQISNEIPKEYKLFQNYPNPFNPNSKIKFQISKLSDVKFTVFDILGREIKVLVNEQLLPGTYETVFDASNYSSGVYYYNLTAYPSGLEFSGSDDYSLTKKMILIK